MKKKIVLAICTLMIAIDSEYAAGGSGRADGLSRYLIWVAHYAEKCGYTGSYHIWQNTDKGKVDDVPGYIDMNVSSI